jgi:pyruvate dehydrogenase E2 component (dihydrolipoamide acetyltransferase)
MAIEIVVPQIGEAISELTIVEWRKQEGDHVKPGEVLFEVDSDKAIVEVDAFIEGTLVKILKPAGSAVLPQDVVALVEPLGSVLEPAPAGEISTHEDGRAAKDEPKISPLARRVAEELGIDLSARSGSGPGGRITADDVKAFAEHQVAVPTHAPEPPERVIASPKAKRLAKDQGIDLNGIAGTGLDGLIVTRDLELLVSQSLVRAHSQAPLHPGASIQPLSKLRQTVATRMQASQQTIPHFYLMVDVDMTHAQNLRAYCTQTLNWERPPTYTDLIVRACALALRAMPSFNVSYSDQGMGQHRSVNIGLAVNTEDGLIVPVLPHADYLSLWDTSQQVREIAERARRGRLNPSDLSEKSMAISNLGMYGVDAFVAIIDIPDPMILAVGQIADRIVPVNGQAVIRPMSTFTLSVDHRALDGVQGARFLTRVKGYFEQPFELLG